MILRFSSAKPNAPLFDRPQTSFNDQLCVSTFAPSFIAVQEMLDKIEKQECSAMHRNKPSR